MLVVAGGLYSHGYCVCTSDMCEVRCYSWTVTLGSCVENNEISRNIYKVQQGMVLFTEDNRIRPQE